MSFWKELRRRNVVRVGVAYALVAWIVVQVVSAINEPLGLPDWFEATVLVSLAVGFPVALLFAWAYELTPAGLKRTGDALREGNAAHRTSQKLNYVVVGLLAGALIGWWLTQDTDVRWARDEAIPQIETFIAAGDWEAAFALAEKVNERLPDEPLLEDLWPRFSWVTTIPSEPPGAMVYRRAYAASDDEWDELGTTPLNNIRIPFGLSRIRIELQGYQILERLLGGGVLARTVLPTVGQDLQHFIFSERFKLDTDDTLPPDKVRVPAWVQDVDGETVSFGEFFLDRYEVTNRQYQKFVEAGGYQREQFWEHQFVKDGQTLTFADAIKLFTDKTGRPGPSTWAGGTYSVGQEDYPVGGVNWYEAAAYARFVGQSLPTVHHWTRAYAKASFNWILPASNLVGSGPAEVGQFDDLGWTGAYDMAGNVREWTFNVIGDGNRSIRGGAWIDDYFRALGLTVRGVPPFDRSEINGFRLAATNDERQVAERARRPLRESVPRDFQAEKSVSDDVFAAYLSQYAYDDAVPLNDRPETVVESTHWTRQRISLDAAYGDEQLVLYLFLPHTGAPPYQTVIYGAGGSALFLDSVDGYPVHLDYVLRSGRAVAFPVFKGMFGRRNDGLRPEKGTAAERDLNIQRVQDLKRTIDYLESRTEIDSGALAFYGHSFGGQTTSQVLAMEPRITTSVLYVVGMSGKREVFGEIEPTNYLPRVNMPVLMLNGEYDDSRTPARANAFFKLLGTPDKDKRHVLEKGGHFVPRDVLIRETLNWLDKYLGKPSN